jgi:hypothetical protein
MLAYQYSKQKELMINDGRDACPSSIMQNIRWADVEDAEAVLISALLGAKLKLKFC